MNRQIRHLSAVVVLLFILLFAQLNNIQVVQAAKLNNDPRNNRNAVRDFSEPRGLIQTADGVVIADSKPSNDQYKLIREYPQGDTYANITGFFSFTYGDEGIEKEYNDYLTGKKTSLKDWSDLLTDNVKTDDVTLTINSKVQQAAKDALGNRNGAVVALNPKTGEILAMYGFPSYDPNLLSSHNFSSVTANRTSLLANPNQPMLPRPYRRSYPPGSTMKVVTASAAYDRDPKLTNKSYPVLRSLALPLTNKPLSNFGGEECGGKLPQLFKVSCNTGFGQMGLDMGASNLAGEANGFGFDQTVPLDEPAPAKSTFPSVASFKGRTPFIAYSAIGQADVSATPLQMAMAAGAIGNNGVIMQPHVLKNIRNSEGSVVKSGQDKQWLRATSPDTAKAMTDNMISVVNAGTGTAARIPGIQVAGKTGTAQTYGPYIDAWFTSFAPAADPQIAVCVIVENVVGHNEATGGVVAAPIAQKVIKAALGAS
jgi:penicillin-binding protein A